MAVDGASMVAAAVQAAVRANAPRRTVAATAAAVASVFARLPTASAGAVAGDTLRAGNDRPRDTDEFGNPAQLLDSLRAARRAQRLRKKQRRKERKTSQDGRLANESGAAGPRADSAGDESAAVPAPALGTPAAPLPPSEPPPGVNVSPEVSSGPAVRADIEPDIAQNDGDSVTTSNAVELHSQRTVSDGAPHARSSMDIDISSVKRNSEVVGHAAGRGRRPRRGPR